MKVLYLLRCHYNLNFLFRLNTTEFLYKKRMMKYLGLNQQLYDLGLSLNDLYNITAAQVIQGVKVNSGKSLSSKIGKNQCLY